MKVLAAALLMSLASIALGEESVTDLQNEIETLRARVQGTEAKIAELETTVSLLMAGYQLEQKIEAYRRQQLILGKKSCP